MSDGNSIIPRQLLEKYDLFTSIPILYQNKWCLKNSSCAKSLNKYSLQSKLNANFLSLRFLQAGPDLLDDHAAQHDVLGVHGQPGLGLEGEADQDQGAAGQGLAGKQEQARVTAGHLVRTIIM